MSVREVITLWDTACKAYHKGDFAEAIAALQDIDDDDQTARLSLNQGLCYARVDALDYAQQLYEVACELDEHFALAPFQLASAHFQQGHYADAVKSFKQTWALLRGAKFVDYKQLGLKYKLYACELAFNTYLAASKAGDLTTAELFQERYLDPDLAVSETHKNIKARTTLFQINPKIGLFEPPASKVKNLKSKNFMAKSEVRAGLYQDDKSVEFGGTKVIEKLDALQRVEAKKRMFRPERPGLSADALKKLAVRTGVVDASAVGTHQALYDFEPQAEGDLTMVEGDVLTLKEDQGDGWVKAVNMRTKFSGMVPKDYLSPLTREQLLALAPAAASPIPSPPSSPRPERQAALSASPTSSSLRAQTMSGKSKPPPPVGGAKSPASSGKSRPPPPVLGGGPGNHAKPKRASAPVISKTRPPPPSTAPKSPSGSISSGSSRHMTTSGKSKPPPPVGGSKPPPPAKPKAVHSAPGSRKGSTIASAVAERAAMFNKPAESSGLQRHTSAPVGTKPPPPAKPSLPLPKGSSNSTTGSGLTARLHHASGEKSLEVTPDMDVHQLEKEVAVLLGDAKSTLWYKPIAAAPELKLTDQSHLDFLVAVAQQSADCSFDLFVHS
eukprot:m.17081 g.17081  ORF g.17081 m.17081 type:complete len:611 (-) comp10644_c0_seq2:96-1928(-)